MKASELIRTLSELIALHGDLDIVGEDEGEDIFTIEYYEDSDQKAFVCAFDSELEDDTDD